MSPLQKEESHRGDAAFAEETRRNSGENLRASPRSPRLRGGLFVIDSLVLLKLGGSLITDKRQAETPRLDVLARLAQEIAAARRQNPSLQLVTGHGSGSFGHVTARRYGTRDGVHTAEEWLGFAATADAAARLNRIVTGALLAAGLPVWSIQPGATLRCEDGRVVAGPDESVRLALERGLIPLVHGDVALDSVRGGTIASTEEIFDWLAQSLPPRRIVLVGEVDGVFSADPLRFPAAQPIRQITPATLASLTARLGGSHGTDVTGGMAAKIDQALAMARRQPGLEVIICGGLLPGNVEWALRSGPDWPGTRVVADA
ncbi:MAG: isopentenyl phosphate kinase family protein [Chloroflexi bacterium]|nr:isopentenyl phosphate kinase family protein [Chloroflexota bacterium]